MADTEIIKYVFYRNVLKENFIVMYHLVYAKILIRT